jgi:uncharacterized membrane protein
VAAGRDEHSIAASLGDPVRLAAELRLGHEAPRSATRSFAALVALALIDGVRWLPLVLGLLCALGLMGIGLVALVYAGFTVAVSPFDSPLGGAVAVLLRVVALVAGSVAAFSAARASVLLLVKSILRPTPNEVPQ